MIDTSSDDILPLKQRLAEQEVLIYALQEKRSNREHEIDHLQAYPDFQREYRPRASKRTLVPL